MKFYARSVLLLAFVAVTTQDIRGGKGCDCSICKGVDNKINPIVGKRSDDGGGKSSCNICERRKEMLRMEREQQQKLQKCPFDILGSPNVRGKTSEEIFDDFRELIVPSQNGFFDMMRGVVRTMHGSSVAELNWAKEKEARELAKKRREEAEEARKRKQEAEEAKKGAAPKQEILGPNNPKVTVVLKQTPCGQVIQPNSETGPEETALTKRLPKEADSLKFPEDEVLEFQPMDLTRDSLAEADNSDLNIKENFLHSDLIDQLIGYKTAATSPRHEDIESATKREDSTFKEVQHRFDTTTESPFVKFISNDEMKAFTGRRNFDDFNILPTSLGADRENIQNADYSDIPLSFK